MSHNPLDDAVNEQKHYIYILIILISVAVNPYLKAETLHMCTHYIDFCCCQPLLKSIGDLLSAHLCQRLKLQSEQMGGRNVDFCGCQPLLKSR